MPTFSRSVTRRPLGSEQARPRRATHPIGALVVLLALGAALLSTSPAVAAEEPTDTPSTPAPTAPPTPTPARPGVTPGEELSAPDVPDSPVGSAPPAGPSVTVDAPAVPLTLPTTLTGTRSAGSEVQVQIDDGSGQPLCIAPADGTDSWSCAVGSLPDGPAVPLRIVALRDGATAVERIRVAWLGSPTINSTPRPTTAGQVGGSAYPGAQVTARVSGGDSSCSITADSAGSWTCILSEPLATGTYSATATQSAEFYPGGSLPSAATAVLIDKDAPGAPTITTPGRGAALTLAGGAVAGRGDDGNTVIVFAGIHPVCQAVVSGGSWSCVAGAIPPGTFDLTALQLDPAGNASEKARVPGVVFSASTPSPAPAATVPAPSAGQGPAAPPPGPGAGSSPGAQAGGSPTAPLAPVEGRSPFIRDLDSPTAIGSALRPLRAVLVSDVAAAFALSGGTLLLLVVPGLLGARSLAGRVGGAPSLTGRNRPRYEPRRQASPPNRMAVGIGALGAAAVLVVLSNPVLAQSNYLRLSAAVVLALVVVNAVGTAATVWVGRRAFGLDASIGVRPGLLGASALAALLSRIFTLAPPIAFGQVLSARFGDRTTARGRTTFVLSQTAVLIALSLGGWIAYDAVGTPTTALQLFLTELASTVTFAAAGSAAISLLPAMDLPGRTLLQHSKLVWGAASLVSWTLLFTVVTSVTGEGSALTWLMVAVGAGLFAAFSLGTWAWVRWVEPALGSER